MASMFPTILKNLFSRPVTRRYPYKDIREPPPGYRGKISFDNKKCDLCGDCGRVCPTKAIEVDEQIKQSIRLAKAACFPTPETLYQGVFHAED